MNSIGESWLLGGRSIIRFRSSLHFRAVEFAEFLEGGLGFLGTAEFRVGAAKQEIKERLPIESPWSSIHHWGVLYG